MDLYMGVWRCGCSNLATTRDRDTFPDICPHHGGSLRAAGLIWAPTGRASLERGLPDTVTAGFLAKGAP
jgi:hypothetical protein